MILALVVGVALGAVAVLFILENVSVVTITFLHWQFDGSLSIVLLLAILFGVLLAILFMLPGYIHDTFYLSAVEKQKKDLEQDLAATKRKLAEASERLEGRATEPLTAS